MIEMVRGLVRPVLTAVGFGAVTYLVVMGKVETKEYLVLVALMVGYWFGQRSAGNGAPPV